VLSVANLPVVMNLTVFSEPGPGSPGLTVLTAVQTESVSELNAAGAENISSGVTFASADVGQVGWTLSGTSGAQFDSPRNFLTTGSQAVRNSVPPVISAGNLTTSGVVTPTTTNVQTPLVSKDPEASVIDGVLQESGEILDSALPPSVVVESGVSDSLVLPAAVVPESSQNNPIPTIAVPVVQNAAFIMPATDSAFAIPITPDAVPVLISSASSLKGTSNWQSSAASEFASRVMQAATVTSGDSITHSASVAGSIDRLPFVSLDDETEHGWLAGLTGLAWFSSEYDPLTSAVSSSKDAVDTLPVAVPLASYSVDQQLSSQNLTITAQTKVKPFRDAQRQNSTSTKLVEVAYQHDSLPDLYDSEDVPRALRYVVLPRGPPRKQPDTVLRIMDSDAEAHVLQRLRYSMAPRGPSTVTVEMQSPEKRSFSGPRVSPEESLSVRLVC
jgi:hypothetical protein